MNDDLISRKTLLKELREIMDEPHNIMFLMGIGAAVSIIEHRETAFDKDKVIEELRSEAERWHESGVAYDDEREKGVAEGFRRAMPIVEKGGVA